MVILGLGSNLGNREAHLQDAINRLSESAFSIMMTSPIYESPALLKNGSPEDWDRPFLNMAIMGETDLTPHALLNHIKHIEHVMGRHSIGQWSPREIDIDILAFNNELISNNELTVPHLHLPQRAFALLPFADLAPNWTFPTGHEHGGKTAFEISKSLDVTDLLATDFTVNMPAIAI